MIWGIVFGYIEGRKRTDIIALVLCSTFILASGFAKTVGKAVLNWGVSEFAMPFVTGLLFALPLLGCLWMLESLPPPTDEDRALRTERIPMGRAERKKFFLAFAPGFLSPARRVYPADGLPRLPRQLHGRHLADARPGAARRPSSRRPKRPSPSASWSCWPSSSS